jgi:hypothetical protein
MFIGKPENVADALQKESEKMSDQQSKLEYDSALPHLIGIVKENFGTTVPIIKLAAAGHGYASNGEQKQRQLTANIELMYGTLV